jgi:hypothetical protein
MTRIGERGASEHSLRQSVSRWAAVETVITATSAAVKHAAEGEHRSLVANYVRVLTAPKHGRIPLMTAGTMGLFTVLYNVLRTTHC